MTKLNFTKKQYDTRLRQAKIAAISLFGCEPDFSIINQYFIDIGLYESITEQRYNINPALKQHLKRIDKIFPLEKGFIVPIMKGAKHKHVGRFILPDASHRYIMVDASAYAVKDTNDTEVLVIEYTRVGNKTIYELADNVINIGVNQQKSQYCDDKNWCIAAVNNMAMYFETGEWSKKDIPDILDKYRAVVRRCNGDLQYDDIMANNATGNAIKITCTGLDKTGESVLKHIIQVTSMPITDIENIIEDDKHNYSVICKIQ